MSAPTKTAPAAGTAPAASPGRRLVRALGTGVPVYALLAVLLLALLITDPGFYEPDSFLSFVKRAAPLVILAGLRAGVVQGLREVLLEDPRVREVATAANRSFDAGLLARLAARPDVAFLAPRTRTLSASLLVERPDAPGAGTRVELLPTAPGDPLLPAGPSGADGIVLTASAAARP